VILLTDSNSRIPVTIQPSGQKALLSGDNTALPPLEFIEDPTRCAPATASCQSGDGGVFPAGLLVGQVALGTDRRLRVRLAADYERLEFLRVLRSHAPPADLAGRLRGALRAVVFVHLLPLHPASPGPSGARPPRALAFAWVLRRPDYVPVFLVAGVMLLGRPPVHAAAGALGGHRRARARVPAQPRTGLARHSVPRRMGARRGLLLAMTLARRSSCRRFVDQPQLGLTLFELIVTILAYPVVVAATAFALGLRRAAPGEVDELGRRL
jgi:hypothetical protein